MTRKQEAYFEGLLLMVVSHITTGFFSTLFAALGIFAFLRFFVHAWTDAK